MTITSTTLTRGAAVAAVAAGLIFIGVQINHPHADVTAVTTTEWAVRNSLKVLMAALVLVGITGMYLRQVKQTGVLGLLGYLVFSIGYLLILSTTVISAYVLYVRRDHGSPQNQQVADAEHQIADESEQSVPADLAQVHAGDADQRQYGHQHLQGVPHRQLGRGDGGGVQVGVVDLDADEDQARSDRGGAGGPGEGGGCDGHVRLLFRWSVAGAAGCPERTARCGDRASPDVVTDDVTQSVRRDGRYSRPSSWPRRTAAARVLTSSLVKMRLVWVRSVFRETKR